MPRGTAGELAIRGANIMKGYWNKPAETAAVLEDGWYYSGDGAYMDEEGFVYIVDRLKDMIISGGENVYSAEVENAISLMPGVAEVAVIGIPDERWGETVHAIVVPKAGVTLTADEVIEHCREQIAGYKCPKQRRLPRHAAAALGRRQGPEARAARALLEGLHQGGELTMPGIPPYYDWIAHHAHRRPEPSRHQRPADDAEVDLCRACTAAPTSSPPALAKRGIAKGDRVALLAPNCAEYFELQFACGRLGAIMLPLNWRLTVPELEYILGDSTPKLLIHDKAFAAQANALSKNLLEIDPENPDSAYERALASDAPVPPPVDADARRHRHGDVHLGHDRPSQGRDHHPRHGVLERRQPRHPGDDLAADRAARRSCRCSIPAASTATPTRCCMPAARS